MKDEPEQKVHKTPSQPRKAGHGGATSHPSYVESTNRRISIQA
jgi:hypothetical protein